MLGGVIFVLREPQSQRFPTLVRPGARSVQLQPFMGLFTMYLHVFEHLD